MCTLLWAEYRKLRRSNIVWITIFATVLLAIIVFAEGQGIHDGPDVQYGLKVVYEGSRYIDNAGWYMDEAQPLATMFVLPAVISLLGSYMICREEEDDTMKSLRLIPVDEGKLVAAKMMIAFVFSVLLYLLLFSITFLTEALLHFSDLSVELVLSCMKEYLLDGIGVFLAISPIIAVVPCMKKKLLAGIGIYRTLFHCRTVCGYVKQIAIFIPYRRHIQSFRLSYNNHWEKNSEHSCVAAMRLSFCITLERAES